MVSNAPELALTETPWLAIAGAPGSTVSGEIVAGQLELEGSVTALEVGTTKSNVWLSCWLLPLVTVKVTGSTSAWVTRVAQVNCRLAVLAPVTVP